MRAVLFPPYYKAGYETVIIGESDPTYSHGLTSYRPPTQPEAWARVARALWRWITTRARQRMTRSDAVEAVEPDGAETP
jgi:hypothetical protein